jgi:hypothetical protein
VKAAIAAARPDLAQLWFASGGLDPMLLEVGRASGCIWYGNTRVSVRDAQLNLLDWETTDNTVTVAHEFGHALLGSGHVGHNGEGNLMAVGAGRNDRLLTGGQCTSARTVASRYRKPFYDYNLAIGMAQQQLVPISAAADWLKIPSPGPLPKACCTIDGKSVKVFKGLCSLWGSPAAAEDCKVCCATNDPAFRDIEGAFNIGKVDECAADRTLTVDQCDPVCCDRRANGAGAHTESSYACLADNPSRDIHAGVIVTDTDEAITLCRRDPK